jgi:ABC-type amino acid transport substrate-binding protein
MKRILMCIVLGLLVFTSGIGWSAEVLLRTAYQKDSPPRYFVEGGIDKGVCVDLISALNEKLAKHNIHIVPTGTYTLAEINTMMDKNELNMFVGLMKTPEREQKFVFSSVPVFGVRGQFAKLVSDPFEYTGEGSVRGKRVCVLRGAAINQLITKMPGIRFMEAATINECLKKLRGRETDLVFYHDLGLGWDIKAGGFAGQIALANKPFEADSQYIMFTKQMTIEVKIIVSNELLELDREGTIDKILRAYR